MRVNTGSAKGYGLKAPKHMHLRPTPSRMKEAIFSSFRGLIPGSSVLELFAGTGAFSIECLSQGAASSVMVEKDRRTLKLIEENLRKTHLEDKARVIHADVRQAMERLAKEEKRYDIIFADPPYQKASHLSDRESRAKAVESHSQKKLGAEFSWTQYLVDAPEIPKLLGKDGIFLLEYFRKENWIPSPTLEFIKDFRFGDTVVAVFKKSPFHDKSKV